jgi:hypothetical protein
MLLIHVKGCVQVGYTVPNHKDGDQGCILMGVGVVYVHELNIKLEALSPPSFIHNSSSGMALLRHVRPLYLQLMSV